MNAIKFVLVPLITVLAFTKLCLNGGWPEATITIAGFAWICYDAYIAYLEEKHARELADIAESRVFKDKGEFQKLQERVAKLELRGAFNKKSSDV